MRSRPSRSRLPLNGKPYEVEEFIPPQLSLPGEVVIAESADEVIDRLAADLVQHAEGCVREFGDFHLALSGGSTPEPLYQRLMFDPDFRRLPWRRTHLWVVDERCVPLADARSNFRMIAETIVDHADIPPEQVHPMLASQPEADSAYERQIRETLAWREKGQDRLDFVLLGMGVDGHTASLFPGSEALREAERLVRLNHAPTAEPPERMTMTYPLINAARFVAALVTGAGKARTIQRVCDPAVSADEIPIKGVNPLQGELRWYIDGPAAGVGVAD